MLVELIKLSKELYELDMVDDSIHIDNMIHRIYGSPVSCKSKEESICDTHHMPPPCEHETHSFREEMLSLSLGHMFKDELASIIFDVFSADDVEYIRNLLTEYIE